MRLLSLLKSSKAELQEVPSQSSLLLNYLHCWKAFPKVYSKFCNLSRSHLVLFCVNTEEKTFFFSLQHTLKFLN